MYFDQSYQHGDVSPLSNLINRQEIMKDHETKLDNVLFQKVKPF